MADVNHASTDDLNLLTPLEQEMLNALRLALTSLERTEAEFGITLGSANCVRDAIGDAERACRVEVLSTDRRAA